MGMLNEMFGDEKEQIVSAEATLLAEGNYVGDTDTILSGYKTFRKKYVYTGLVLKLFVVFIALASSVMMLITSEKGDVMPIFCLLLCFAAGLYFLNEPISNKKKLKKALETLQGIEYNAQIYSDKIIISTVQDKNVENANENVVTENDVDDVLEDDIDNTDEDNQIPATVIHIDSPIVDFIDREDMFIVCVKKSYVFIIPKSAFSEDEINSVKDRMKIILGVRYKVA